MTSPSIDRRLGLLGSTALKAPATAVATSNITLRGQQTIDGVAVKASNAAGVADRVLCVGQTDATQNGLWDVSLTDWTRSLDADGNYDLKNGTVVVVSQGSTNYQSVWQIATVDPITPGSTLMSWARAVWSAVANAIFLQSGIGAISRGFQDKIREIEINVTDFMTDTQKANVAAGTGSPTLDRASIQSAFNAIPAQGGKLKLPAGKMVLDATQLDFRNKSNFTVEGAGMGVSIIDGTAVTGGATNCVLLMGNAGGAASLNNVTLRDFTICGSGTVATGNIVNYRGINNVAFERLEVYGGYREVLYCDGPNPAFDGLRVIGCYFHDCFAQLSACINTNTTGVTNILIEGNRFERVATGTYILGKNARIVNNAFVDVSNVGIGFAESNETTHPSFSSFVIAGNTFTGMGRSLVGFGGAAFFNAYGINQNAKPYPYADNGEDSGVVIANNTFKDSYTDIALRLIRVTAGAKVVNNYASGVLTNTSAVSIFIDVSFASDSNSGVGVNATPVYVYLSGNVLEQKPAGLNIQFGLQVLSSQNAYLHMSHNVMDAVAGGAQFYSTGNGFLPLVTADGDIFSPGFNLYNLAGTNAGLGTTRTPIYGSNANTFRTPWCPDLFPTEARHAVGGSTTPSVAAGAWFYCVNAAPTTVTDFLEGANDPKEITITFNDVNTTVKHDVNKIRLNGSVDFVSTVGASLTLYKPQNINTAWVEKGRSKP